MISEKIRETVQKGKIRLLLLAVSGALMALPIVFPTVGFLGWIGLVPGAAVLLTAARDPSVRLRRMYGYGFLYFLPFYAVGFHWFIAMYPLSFIDGMSKPEALAVVFVATFGLSALQASVSALFGVILALVARGGIGKRFPILLPVTAGLLYPIFEWAQTFTWMGVPWSRLAAGQVEAAAILKSVSLFGPYFLAALLVTVNFLLAELLLSEEGRQRRICACASAMIVGLNACLGGVLLALDRDSGEGITAAAIQPNVSSLDPWGFDTVDEAMELLEQYSLDAATNGAKLIVWPETVFPLDFVEGSEIWDFSCEIARECDATIVVGSFTRGETGDRNSLIYIGPDGIVNETVYAKRRLVPFGEFVPWRGFFEAIMPQLADLLMLDGDLEQSNSPNVADTDVGRLGGIVCFDSIYEGLTIDTAREGAELLILSTNDSWFTGSKAVDIHASQARLRAVETGKYLVRSASTGISMIITPDGRVLDREEDKVGGYVISTVYPRTSKTLYTVIGNSFTYLSIAFVLTMLASAFCEQVTNKRSTLGKNVQKYPKST